MKRLLIPIFMFLPLLSVQAQSVTTEEQQLEEAKKQLEAAKKALEVAKMKAEAARIKAQADSINAAAKKAEAEAKATAAAKAEAKKAEVKPTTAKEPTTAVGGWAIPTATTPKVEEKKAAPLLHNGKEVKVDPKYLEGAITNNSEGKIEFTLDTDCNGKSADEIYDIVFKFLSELTQGEQNIKSRVALVNKSERIIATVMDEWLVFNQSFISLDRAEFKYQLVANITDNHLHLSLGRIFFEYETDRPTGFKEPAENVIADKVALNKKRDNLARIYGKFRKGTINRKDQIFKEIKMLVAD